jgi:macrodomain Ter protein organizer (MatP/YcbG family)
MYVLPEPTAEDLEGQHLFFEQFFQREVETAFPRVNVPRIHAFFEARRKHFAAGNLSHTAGLAFQMDYSMNKIGWSIRCKGGNIDTKAIIEAIVDEAENEAKLHLRMVLLKRLAEHLKTNATPDEYIQVLCGFGFMLV